MLDHAWTFSKDGKCLAVFAATNDDIDQQQALGGLAVAPIDFCGFSVHAGVVDEVAGFMKADTWADFIMYLNSPTCTSVTSVGHSLGGAIATVFAGCANVGALGGAFGPRKDYGLVVYAPFGVSTTPIYSGTPGTPFAGVRYGITDSDGGASSLTPLPEDTRQFRLDLLKFYESLTKGMGHPAATQLSEAYQQFSQLPAASIEPAWAQVEPSLVEMVLPTLQIAIDPPAGLEAYQPMVHQLVATIAGRGELFINYDLVSSLSRPFGFKHALVDFQPLPMSLTTGRTTPYTMVAASDGAAELPKHDTFQQFLAILTDSAGFANHAICCYSTASECSSKFTVDWKKCRPSIFFTDSAEPS